MGTKVLQLPVIREGFMRSTSMMDQPTGIRCPRCCKREIVYNGNYFCSGYGGILSDGDQKQECGWALPHTDIAPHFTEPHHVDLQKALIDNQNARVGRDRKAREARERKRSSSNDDGGIEYGCSYRY